jgi:hypothetical protein
VSGLRRVLRVMCALWRFAKRHAPKWLLPVLVACAFIPGPLDELLVLAVVAFPVLRSAANRAELVAAVRAAWNRRQ